MTLQQKVAGTFVPVGGAAAEDWVRPADWLTLPAVVEGEQKFVGLVAVYPSDSNWVSLTIGPAYIVDWGDGSAPENIASGRADHNFLTANVPSETLTTHGYRQAIVTVTMQGANTMQVLNLNVKSANVPTGFPYLWLDIKVASSFLNNLTISGTTSYGSNLQQFEFVGASSIASNGPLFTSCTSLRKVVGTAWTAGCTNFTNMFNNTGLTTVPLLDTSSGTNFTGMFSSCSRLTTVPLLDTSSGTNFTSMFNGCSQLTTIPLLDTSSGTNFTSMFSSCAQLRAIPSLSTSSGTNFSAMFVNCTLLKEVPPLATSLGTTFTQMFLGCMSLVAIPSLVTSGATTGHASMFSSCFSLQTGAMTGTKLTISYASCSLSAAALNAIYAGLATVVGQTITVTGNWGTAGDDPSIATAKGWTVTG